MCRSKVCGTLRSEKFSLNFIFLAAFACQMIVGVVSIAVPIYANMLGASLFIVGLIGSAGGLVYSFMPLVSGILCDRIGRKNFISASLFSYGASCLLYSLVQEPLMFIPIKILEWISVAAFWPAVESLIADSALERLEDALKKFNISWGSAMVVGPLLGGILIDELSIKAPFVFSMLILISFGVLSILVVREPPKLLDAEKGSGENREMDGERDGSIVTALATIFLFSSIVGILMSLFPSYARDLGISAFEIGVMAFTFGVARAVTFYHATRIEERIKKTGMFLAGSLTLGFASLITFYSSTALLFLICFLIFGFGAGISYAASITFVLKWRKSSRGYAAGVFESLIGVGYFLGPLIGGFLSEFAGNVPYIYGFLLSIIVFLIQLMRRHRFSRD